MTATDIVRDEVKFICCPKSQGMGGWVPKNRTTMHAGKPGWIAALTRNTRHTMGWDESYGDTEHAASYFSHYVTARVKYFGVGPNT